MKRAAAGPDDELSNYDSDSDAPPEAMSSAAGPSSTGEANEQQKAGRANKNRPAQQSIHKRVSTFRIAPGLKAATYSTLGSARRDPRFDADGVGGSSAPFNAEGWRKSYDFLFEKQKQEAGEMKAKLDESQKASKRAKQRGGGAKRQRQRQKVLSEEEEASLRLELERTRNRLAVDDKRRKQASVKAEVRKEEVEAVKQGKKPFFQKAAVLKERELVHQYEELKKTGKLEKFLARRRKKVEGKRWEQRPPRGDALAAGGPDQALRTLSHAFARPRTLSHPLARAPAHPRTLSQCAFSSQCPPIINHRSLTAFRIDRFPAACHSKKALPSSRDAEW